MANFNQKRKEMSEKKEDTFGPYHKRLICDCGWIGKKDETPATFEFSKCCPNCGGQYVKDRYTEIEGEYVKLRGSVQFKIGRMREYGETKKVWIGTSGGCESYKYERESEFIIKE